MKPVELHEIKDIAQYETERRTWRPHVMSLKDRRRVRVGDHLTFLFENRDTVRYQIQEMMRIERIVDAGAIRHEVDTYNELIPFRGELSASLLIEYPTVEERRVKLHELLGLENHVWIEVSGAPSVLGRFDTRQIATDRISSVQYVKFTLPPEARARWSQGVRIVVDHPHYRANEPLTPDQLREIGADLED